MEMMPIVMIMEKLSGCMDSHDAGAGGLLRAGFTAVDDIRVEAGDHCYAGQAAC